MEEFFVSTSDNPYNYFTQFDDWYAFDTAHGYNTCAYLARLARTSQELSDNDNTEIINRVVDEVIRLNLTGNYIKVTNNEDGKIKKLVHSSIDEEGYTNTYNEDEDVDNDDGIKDSEEKTTP